MDKDKLFEQAKHDVFGEPPKCKKRLVGYNIASVYYGNHILEAEQALREPAKLSDGLRSYFKYAGTFPDCEPALQAFPKKTRKAIRACADKFNERYAPLMAGPTDPSPS